MLCAARRSARPSGVVTSPAMTVRNGSRMNLAAVKEHMDVIGADGVHVGTVDRVEGGRIKLTKDDSGAGHHQGHHHYISGDLVAEVEGTEVRLSAIGAVAVSHETEGDGKDLN